MDNLDIIESKVGINNRKLNSIVQALNACNIPIRGITEGNIDEDPIIHLDKNCRIQIELNGRLSLSQDLPNGCIRGYPSHRTMGEVIYEYRGITSSETTMP
jgi:hypothetical protein